MPHPPLRAPLRYPKDYGYPHYTLKPGDVVHVVSEPENPVDPNALAIHDRNHRRMGYLPKDLAAGLAPALRAGDITITGAQIAEVNSNRIPVLVVVSMDLG